MEKNLYGLTTSLLSCFFSIFMICTLNILIIKNYIDMAAYLLNAVVSLCCLGLIVTKMILRKRKMLLQRWMLYSLLTIFCFSSVFFLGLSIIHIASTDSFKNSWFTKCANTPKILDGYVKAFIIMDLLLFISRFITLVFNTLMFGHFFCKLGFLGKEGNGSKSDVKKTFQ